MNIEIYKTLDDKEKLLAETLLEIVQGQKELVRLMARFVAIMEKAEADLV